MPETVAPEVLALLATVLGDRSRPVSQDDLRALAAIEPDRIGRYATARDYYEGKQGTLLTDRLKTYLERSKLAYCENFCATVVDALAERLIVVGVSTDLANTSQDEETGATIEEDELGDWLWDTWDHNRGDKLQTITHAETTECGDGFVIVDYRVGFGPVLTYNDPELMKPIYENSVMVAAVKVWDTSSKSPVNPDGRIVRRMNVYRPDRIEKWFTLANDKQKAEWIEWLDEGEKVWPTPWTDPTGEPLGVPVFHFANMQSRRSGLGRPEHYNTIPQQDRLNKELIDLSAVLDAQGFPQRWATGVAGTSGLTTEPGTVWTADAGQFGQFQAADVSGPIKAVESTLIRIATRSRTPAHLIYLSTGGLPSGESLKTAEAGLVKKTKNRQIFHGEVWGECLRMAALVALSFGMPDERPAFTIEQVREASINVRWEDPETRNEKEHLDSLVVMKDLGVSEDTILSMIPGIDPAEEREKKEANAATVGEQMIGGMVNPASVLPGPMDRIPVAAG